MLRRSMIWMACLQRENFTLGLCKHRFLIICLRSVMGKTTGAKKHCRNELVEGFASMYRIRSVWTWNRRLDSCQCSFQCPEETPEIEAEPSSKCEVWILRRYAHIIMHSVSGTAFRGKWPDKGPMFCQHKSCRDPLMAQNGLTTLSIRYPSSRTQRWFFQATVPSLGRLLILVAL